MDDFFASFFSGLLSLGGLFFLSAVIVISAKTLIYFIKSKLPQSKPIEEPEKPKRQYNKKPKSPSAIRSIEINPEEIDRIYVRKIQ